MTGQGNFISPVSTSHLQCLTTISCPLVWSPQSGLGQTHMASYNHIGILHYMRRPDYQTTGQLTPGYLTWQSMPKRWNMDAVLYPQGSLGQREGRGWGWGVGSPTRHVKDYLGLWVEDRHVPTFSRVPLTPNIGLL